MMAITGSTVALAEYSWSWKVSCGSTACSRLKTSVRLDAQVVYCRPTIALVEFTFLAVTFRINRILLLGIEAVERIRKLNICILCAFFALLALLALLVAW